MIVNQDKKAVKKKKKDLKKKKPEYIYAVGRRRTAVARIRLFVDKKGGIEVNGQPVEKYFPGKLMQVQYQSPLRTCNVIGKYLITVKVFGSGIQGQLGAVIHGITRVLVKLDEEKFRPVLKKRNFLTRDPRMRERRKVGTGGKARRKKQSPKR